ncbi:MAG: hydrolase [Thermodesulfobacteriota bacterium]
MSDQNRPRLIEVDDSALIMIDLQEKLWAVMAEKERVRDNAVRLAKFAQIVKLPVVLTEQENLGSTLSEIDAEGTGAPKIGKICFDCFGEPAFVNRLESLRRRVLILAGIEAHICVLQTALSALDKYQVHVVADACGSRGPHNHELALDRLRQSGAVITTTETVIYELLRRAGTPEFRAALKLVK